MYRQVVCALLLWPIVAWPVGQPGVMVTFESAAGGADTAFLPHLALYVEAGKPPTPFLPAGKFTATWEGNVNADLRSDYLFDARLNGSLKLEINGATVLEGSGPSIPLSRPVQLNKGANKLRAVFSSPNQGDAFLRVGWTETGTNTSPIPRQALTHAPTPEFAKASQLRRGRELFLEHRCGRCHTVGEASSKAAPELAMDAPTFEGIGARRNHEWMVRWILDPKAERPTALMPQMFRGPNAEKNARAAGAYLASLKGGGTVSLSDPRPGAAPPGDPPAAPLFERLQCVACHTTEGATADDTNKISLTHVPAKFPPGKLAEFLRQPEAHYAWIRMPNFRLTTAEANELAESLTKGAAPTPATPPDEPALIEQGKKLVESAGCLNCHGGASEVKSSAPGVAALTAESWTRGCLAESPPEKAPQFKFTADERADLRAFGRAGASSLFRHAPAEFAERQVRALNCTGCHGQFEGFPPLEILGGKLKPEWAGAFIAGEIPYKPRAETHPRGEPWLAARMPGFKARARLLAEGMAALHGYGPHTPAEPPVDPELARIGQKLVGKEGGFSCVSCHGVGSLAATDVFDSEGINLVYSYERLLRDYYYRWMRNPLSIDPQTKMPVYFEEGKSPLTEVLDGDAEKQITAVWQYLRLGDKMPAPNTGEAP